MNNTLQYKGYYTTITYSAEDRVLFGKLEGISDLITFESDGADGIEQAFHEAVDDYLAYCAEVGKEPEKTYKGMFNVRIAPELHRTIAMIAKRDGVSLNQEVERALTEYAARATHA